jgi:hypothetical protein
MTAKIGEIMKRLVLTAAALMIMGGAPAMAMSCCGKTKSGASMCAKPGMAMNKSGMGKSAKAKGCCCGGMAMNMSKRG